MIAAGQLVTRDPIPVRTVYHHQPGLLAQFDRHENRANMANDGCANVGCMHLTSPMVRVCKPKPIGCTPIAPWNLRLRHREAQALEAALLQILIQPPAFHLRQRVLELRARNRLVNKALAATESREVPRMRGLELGRDCEPP